MRKAMRNRTVAAAGALLVALALTGCGVSATKNPTDIGEAYAPKQYTDANKPAEPDATTPVQLIRDFLDAAAGGGEAAVTQVSKFLTGDGRKQWHAPDKDAHGITIIRVVSVKDGLSTVDGVPINVDYQVIGTLNDFGEVTPAVSPQHGTIHFVVGRAEDRPTQLRIKTMIGAPTGLFLADQALDNTYYRQQPIYFWDTANRTLVPDLRYVAQTIPFDQRANAIVSWLIHGPSSMLDDSVNTLPISTATTAGATLKDTSLTVKLTAQSGGKGPDDVRRLYYQFQASLLPGTDYDLQLSIGNTQVHPGGALAYQDADLSSSLPTPIHKYDIVDGVVKPTNGDINGPSPSLAVLAVKENSHVQFAAINRQGNTAAYVRQTGSNEVLSIINEGSPARNVTLPKADDAGRPRPAWIPGTDALLLAWAGKLYLYDANGVRHAVDTQGLSDITAVAIAPDGRRVALVAGGQVYIAAMSVGDTVTLGKQPQQITVDPALVPSSVAWESEERIYVVGAAGAAGGLWLVTTDSVVTTNFSSSLKGAVATDVVAFPQGIFTGNAEAIVQTDGGSYRIGGASVAPDGTKNPLYVA